ncbi:MAG: EamA family transporter [Candidatus Pelagibacter sp.]|nr:EamA family transporter [Candidatus Pelagibacter sp.]OUV87155.1 MAG: EamA family transporter [Pelagibacteraceae bacterium TMED136]
MKKKRIQTSSLFQLSLLFIQPVFMTSNLAIARGALGNIPPISLACSRWIIVFLVFFPFIYQNIKKKKKYFKKEFWQLFFLSATGYAGCGALPYISGLTTTVTNMSIIYALSPIFIVLLSACIYSERLKFLQYCAVLLSLFGVFFIIFKGQLINFLNLNFSIGDLWIFGAAMCWSLFSIFLINWKSKFNIIERFTLMSLLGSLILIPFFLIEHFLYLPTNFDFNYLKFTFMAAIFPGIIAFLMYTKLQQVVGASITGLTVYLMPIYGAIYGIFLFYEKLDVYHFYGAAFVVIGIFFAKKKYK